MLRDTSLLDRNFSAARIFCGQNLLIMLVAASLATIACSSSTSTTPQIGGTLRNVKTISPPPVLFIVNPTSSPVGEPAGLNAIPDEHTSYLNDTIDGSGYFVFTSGGLSTAANMFGGQALETTDFVSYSVPSLFSDPIILSGYETQTPPSPLLSVQAPTPIRTFLMAIMPGRAPSSQTHLVVAIQ